MLGQRELHVILGSFESLFIQLYESEEKRVALFQPIAMAR